jgi:hypothetical protein
MVATRCHLTSLRHSEPTPSLGPCEASPVPRRTVFELSGLSPGIEFVPWVE